MTLDVFHLLAVLVAALVGGRAAMRLGYPAVLGEIVVGVALGPGGLALLQSSPALGVLADLGVLVMMVYIGMTVEVRELRAASWAGAVVAIGGFLAPAALCGALALAWGESPAAAAFVGIASGVTALAVNARILSDLDLLATRLAHVMMAGALLTDALCLVGLTALLRTDAAPLAAVSALAFFALMGLATLVVLPRMRATLRRLADPAHGFGVTPALVLCFSVAALSEAAGVHAIIGAFFAGLCLQEESVGAELAGQLRAVVHDMSIGFLAPIFFVTTGFLVSFPALSEDLGAVVLFVALATIGKVGGTLVAHRLAGGAWREGLVLGLAMNGRGAVEIILAGLALEAGLIDTRLFSVLVVLAVITTAAVPPALRWGIPWLERHGELDRPPAG